MMEILKFLIGIVDLDVVDFPFFSDLPGKYSSSEYCIFMPDNRWLQKIFYKQKMRFPVCGAVLFFVIYKWEDFGSFTFAPSISPLKPSNDTPQVSSSDAACCTPSCNKFQCPEGGK